LSQINKEDDFLTFENMYITEAEVYAALGMEDEVLEVYEAAEEKLGTTSATIYVNHLRYLYNKYKEQNPDVSSWNAPDILAVYEAGSQVPGIADNFEWKPLIGNLQPLLNKSADESESAGTSEDGSGVNSHEAQDGETVIDPEESSTEEHSATEVE
jgi:hypothetical protein